MPELVLGEWERRDPLSDEVLVGRTLDDPRVAALARDLGRMGALRIDEARHGLVVQARQHVGVVQLGDLRIQVRPKVPTKTLWTLLAYGLGLDDLPEHPPVELSLDGTYPDLLASMLVVEAERLWHRGLARGYLRREEWLRAPRGRPDLAVLSRNLPLTKAALPCRHHAFTSDTLDNRIVLSGLMLAQRLVGSTRLRALLHRTAETWRMVCEPLVLDVPRLDAAERGRTRLTTHYQPIHRLVRALVERSGPDDELRAGNVVLNGALWNMATLFERVVARFLSDFLPEELHVATQFRLPRLYTVERGPRGQRAPDPRPDLVISRAMMPVAVLDTKYRDLSVTRLPREILYQMSVYSLAFGGAGGVPAIVLYAVPSGERAETWFSLRVQDGADRTIVLRAVPLDRLTTVLRAREAARQLATSLVDVSSPAASRW